MSGTSVGGGSEMGNFPQVESLSHPVERKIKREEWPLVAGGPGSPSGKARLLRGFGHQDNRFSVT